MYISLKKIHSNTSKVVVFDIKKQVYRGKTGNRAVVMECRNLWNELHILLPGISWYVFEISYVFCFNIWNCMLFPVGLDLINARNGSHNGCDSWQTVKYEMCCARLRCRKILCRKCSKCIVQHKQITEIIFPVNFSLWWTNDHWKFGIFFFIHIMWINCKLSTYAILLLPSTIFVSLLLLSSFVSIFRVGSLLVLDHCLLLNSLVRLLIEITANECSLVFVNSFYLIFLFSFGSSEKKRNICVRIVVFEIVCDTFTLMCQFEDIGQNKSITMCVCAFLTRVNFCSVFTAFETLEV